MPVASLISNSITGVDDGVAHLLAQDAGRDAGPEITLDPHVDDVIVSARLVV